MASDVRAFRLHSQASDNNKPHILARITEVLTAPGVVLEVGSGSGQHAVYFAGHLPHITWQPTDRPEFLGPLCDNIREFAPANVESPLELDVSMDTWPLEQADHLFTANSLHIMSSDHVKALIEGAGRVVRPGGYLIIYGPFKYNGAFTTDSNARFDEMLRARDPASGIRDFEQVDELARRARFEFVADHDMPANNQLLIYRQTD